MWLILFILCTIFALLIGFSIGWCAGVSWISRQNLTEIEEKLTQQESRPTLPPQKNLPPKKPLKKKIPSSQYTEPTEEYNEYPRKTRVPRSSNRRSGRKDENEHEGQRDDYGYDNQSFSINVYDAPEYEGRIPNEYQ
jgi:hypothetical protein